MQELVENIEGEIWKVLLDTDERFFVSNKGRIKKITVLVWDDNGNPKPWKEHLVYNNSVRIDAVPIAFNKNGKRYERPEKILVVPTGTDGYKRVVLDLGHDENGKRKIKSLSIHRAVAQLFIPNPENKEQVNHKDGIKTNNNISNLEWNTPKENVQHAFNTGLAYARQGVEANKAKIKSDADIERLKDMYFSGKTSYEVGEAFGISNVEVLDIVQGRRFKSHFSQEEYDRRIASRVVENKQVGMAHPRCKADAARIQEALELYKSGMQIKDIAKKYGVNRHAVSRWLHSKWGAGIATNAQAGMSHSQTKVTPELYRKACEMRDQGFTPNYIGNKLGFNRNTIVKWFTHDWYKDLLKDDDNKTENVAN